MKKFSGCDFSDKLNRKHIKYVVVIDGDLDFNGARGCHNKKEVKEYIKWYKVQAVFLVKDVTNKFSLL